MMPQDWIDLPQRLRKAEEQAKKCALELEALRQLVVEQALEIQRLNNAQSIPLGRTDALPPALAGGDARKRSDP